MCKDAPCALGVVSLAVIDASLLITLAILKLCEKVDCRVCTLRVEVSGRRGGAAKRGHRVAEAASATTSASASARGKAAEVLLGRHQMSPSGRSSAAAGSRDRRTVAGSRAAAAARGRDHSRGGRRCLRTAALRAGQMCREGSSIRKSHVHATSVSAATCEIHSAHFVFRPRHGAPYKPQSRFVSQICNQSAENQVAK